MTVIPSEERSDESRNRYLLNAVGVLRLLATLVAQDDVMKMIVFRLHA
jgi:hypothetical protein